MPRHARLRFPGLPLHIVQRGNNRNACFFTDNDRLVYLGLLQELLDPCGCALHAYVLMTNHVHLLLTPTQADSASLLMKRLGQEYVQYVNRSQGRTGSLWEGRFRSSVVDAEVYGLRCSRYIELNPVRGHVVSSPADYPWSSFGANALGHRSALITPSDAYMALGRTEGERAAAYRALFAGDLTADEIEEIRLAVNGGFVLGCDAFRDALFEWAGRPVSRRRKRRCAASGTDPGESGLRGLSPNRG